MVPVHYTNHSSTATPKEQWPKLTEKDRVVLIRIAVTSTGHCVLPDSNERSANVQATRSANVQATRSANVQATVFSQRSGHRVQPTSRLPRSTNVQATAFNQRSGHCVQPTFRSPRSTNVQSYRVQPTFRPRVQPTFRAPRSVNVQGYCIQPDRMTKERENVTNIRNTCQQPENQPRKNIYQPEN